MVFSSLPFLYVFLPLCIISYFIFKNKTYRNIVLVVFSLIFYAWGEPVLIGLMIFSSLFNYVMGIYIDKYKDKKVAKILLWVSVAGNLGMLGFFKYTDFFIGNLNVLFSSNIPLLKLMLPIGISFYTFQTMSYTIDVYRKEVAVQRSFIKLIMYVSLFPQLIAGPIVRYSDIEKEIDNRQITMTSLSYGITRFAIGLGKKVLIANTCGMVVDTIFKSGTIVPTTLGTWLGIIMFTFQIFFDFSGYSDMAIGLGKVFGFTYKENFNYPYVSKSATEFWRRWHISLGSFFRDYLYIPLGGNRKSWLRNLFVVWFLTGLWHGASWNFILWGLFYGALICIEKLFLGKFLEKLPRLVSYIYMFLVTTIGWTLFYFTDLPSVWTALKNMFFIGGVPITDDITNGLFGEKFLVLVVAFFFSLPIMSNLLKKIQPKLIGRLAYIQYAAVAITNAALLIISTITLVGQTYNPFLYFRF